MKIERWQNNMLMVCVRVSKPGIKAILSMFPALPYLDPKDRGRKRTGYGRSYTIWFKE